MKACDIDKPVGAVGLRHQGIPELQRAAAAVQERRKKNFAVTMAASV
jgi:hypothetical protein